MPTQTIWRMILAKLQHQENNLEYPLDPSLILPKRLFQVIVSRHLTSCSVQKREHQNKNQNISTVRRLVSSKQTLRIRIPNNTLQFVPQ